MISKLRDFAVDVNGTIEMYMADESHPALATDPYLHDVDKGQFVRNLGALLAQTREGVVGCKYHNDRKNQIEMVTVEFDNGYTKTINVTMDSYKALIKDVCGNI